MQGRVDDAARHGCALFRALPDALPLVMPFVAPEDYNAVSRVSQRWHALASANFVRYLAWREDGRFYRMAEGGAVPAALDSRASSYHLDGRDCYALTREGLSLTGSAKIRLRRKLLLSGGAGEAVAAPSTPDVLALQGVVFAFMYDDAVVALSTEQIDMYSLRDATVLAALKPTAAQLARGMKFTNIVSCHTAGARRRLACKMRPGADGGPACVNLYEFSRPAEGAAAASPAPTVLECKLKKVRSCQLSERYLVMKGMAGADGSEPAALEAAAASSSASSLGGSFGTGSVLSTPGAGELVPAAAAAKDVDVAVAYNVATLEVTESRDPLFKPDPNLPFAQKDVSLIGADAGGGVVYFLQPSGDAKVLPSAWCRWSDRLLRKRTPRQRGFQLLRWDIAARTVQPVELCIAHVPAPYGWPSHDPLSLTLSKDNCKLADNNTVFVCLFARTSAACPKGLGILCIYTKTGHIMATLDPTSPRLRSIVCAADAGDAAQQGDAADRAAVCSDRFRPQDYEVGMELLAAHKASQQLLFSVGFRQPNGAWIAGKVLAKEFGTTAA
eukprot:TRINITY_DN16131_c0_g1_i1.p1 TRINITY_DN16131_c0_g1~~TRINITY_DN16131_c0_g1_i1.p1  ORF type:complete len:557 (+),score=194.29 TRINITY_DN16131_c0_g1_i1:94-1764(+)